MLLFLNLKILCVYKLHLQTLKILIADAFRQEFTEINCTAGTISKYSHCVDNIDKVFFFCFDIQRINGSYSCEDTEQLIF